MNAATYLSQLAQQLGCTYSPKSTTFTDDNTSNEKGVVIGACKGYLVALALTRAGRTTGFAIMVRYPATMLASQILEAVKSRPGFSTFLHQKSVAAIDNGLVVSWSYIVRPKPEDVMDVLDAIVEEVSRYAPAFTGKCENCGAAETREITLMNSIPGYYCSSCQVRVAAEKRREAAEYKARPANYLAGTVVGVLAAGILGRAWGELSGWFEARTGSLSPPLHIFVTFLIGMTICWAVFKTIGKRDRTGQAMAILLTLAGKWWGDALSYSHVALHFYGVPFAQSLATLKHFFEYEFMSGLRVFVFGCDLFISAMMTRTPWGRLPKFEPVFQTLNADGSLTRKLAKGAGAQ